MKDKGLMKISELVRASGVPASTIRYYIWEGLLPRPIKTGKTRAYYTRAHLVGLAQIRKKQIENLKPLVVIKEEMRQKTIQTKDVNETALHLGRREAIIQSAIGLFFKKGYAGTTVADIVQHAHASKETFYQQYKDKDELFIECADRIFHEMYNDVWQEIREEKDMAKRIRKRVRAFFASYPRWIVMMNLVRSASVSENLVFKAKFRQVVKEIIEPLVRDLERLLGEGRIRSDIDTTLACYIAMGMTEYGAALVHHGLYSEEEVFEYLDTVFQLGLKA
jgi:AcrR family transcriptional regulator